MWRSHRRTLLSFLMCLICAAYIWRAWIDGPAPNEGGPSDHGRNRIDYFALLTDAFLAGHTHLLVDPAPEMLRLSNPRDPAANRPYRLHDASLYNGRYYLYFGPAPALVLFVPFKIVAGFHLPTRLAVAIFCIGGYLSACALFFTLSAREAWRCPLWLEVVLVILLGTCTRVFLLVRRPSFYEVSIAAGSCFLLAGVLAIVRFFEQRKSVLCLVVSGACFGLAAGSRANLAIISAAALCALLVWGKLEKTQMLAFALPILVCGISLAAYNFARFGDPLETGIRYQLTGALTDQGVRFHLENIPPGFWFLLFQPPLLGGRPPYFHIPADLYPFGTLRSDYIAAQNLGLLWAAPCTVLALFAPFYMRRWKESIKSASTWFALYFVTAASLLALVSLSPLGWIYPRYSVDFAPGMVVVSCCLIAAYWHELIRRGQKALRSSIVLAIVAIYSVALNVSTCFRSLPPR